MVRCSRRLQVVKGTAGDQVIKETAGGQGVVFNTGRLGFTLYTVTLYYFCLAKKVIL